MNTPSLPGGVVFGQIPERCDRTDEVHPDTDIPNATRRQRKSDSHESEQGKT
jgi:hypothetical protein